MILEKLVKIRDEYKIKSYLKLKRKFSSKEVKLIVKECMMGNLADIITDIIIIIDSTGYEFSQPDKDGLTKAICETKDAEKIFWFVRNVKNLSKNNIDNLTKAICETKDASYIYYFARDVKNLTEDNINNLTKAICETKDAFYIYYFARDVKNLTEDNINNLTKAICEIKDASYIYYFACDVKNLTEDNKKALIKVICEITTFGKLEGIMLKYNFEYVILSEQFKNKIIESKDKILIAEYIIVTNDTELMNKIFDGLLQFESFYIINKNSINVSDKKMYAFLNKNLNNSFKYVDDNIDDYINDNSKSKKPEHK